MEFNRVIDFKEGKHDVITLGELVVDFISSGYLQKEGSRLMKDIDSFSRHFGGSPGNIAVNLRALGLNPRIIAGVGEDFLGDYLLDFLHQRGVNLQGITRVKKDRTSIVFVSKSMKNPSFLALRGSDKTLTHNEIQDKIVDEGKILHFTSWSLSHEPSRSTALRLLERAKEKGLKISFDPNFRGVLWEDPEEGRRLIKRILPLIDIMKPSYDDAYNLFGAGHERQDSPEEYMESFLKHGTGLVILTLGEEGLLAGNGKKVLRLPSYGKLVVDTTGAGDAFWSGMYASLLRGYPLEKALRHGSYLSAYKLRYTGGIAPLPSFEDIIKKEEG